MVWAMGSALVCWNLKRNYAWTVALAFACAAFSALRILQYSLNGVPINPVTREFTTAAASALLSLSLTILTVRAVSLHFWVRIFRALALINAIVIVADRVVFSIQSLADHRPLSVLAAHEPWGLLLNASMSGCFNAAIFPLFEKHARIARALVLLSVIAAGRSLPVAVLFVGVGAALVAQRRFRLLFLAIPASLAVGYLVKGPHLFDPQGRNWIWAEAYGFFRDHLHWSIGSGLGGFAVIGPTLRHPTQDLIFTWLHSDWLQIFFELGWIGFLAVLGMYLHALWRARGDISIFGALAGYAMFGVANMPLRYPLAGFLGAFLIRCALERGDGAVLLSPSAAPSAPPSAPGLRGSNDHG